MLDPSEENVLESGVERIVTCEKKPLPDGSVEVPLTWLRALYILDLFSVAADAIYICTKTSTLLLSPTLIDSIKSSGSTVQPIPPPV